MENQTGTAANRFFASAFVTSLFTAFFIYLLEIIFIVAFAALIYSGELSSQIPRVLGFLIIGDAILCAVGAVLSSNPGSIAVEQDAPGAMLSIIAAGIIATLAGNVSQKFATVTMMIVTSTLLTGLLLLLLGVCRLGGLIRFLPYPVIGGFLAGSGWLLVSGGIGIMADVPSTIELLEWDALQLWLPGLLLGITIYIAAERIDKPYIIPVIMLAVSLVFYAVVWAMDIPLADLQNSGWLLATDVSAGRLELALSPAILSQVDWGVLLAQTPALLSVAVICVIDLLLNSSGLELIVKKDIDPNCELVTAGVGNLTAGMAGGLVGFQDISFSTLNHIMPGRKRLVGILVALLIGATVLVGTSAFLYIPMFVFGAVLVYLGFDLLVEWVYEAWFKFSRADFAVIVIIMVILAVRGVLEGVIAGLILAVFSFVVSYSRVSVIKLALTGREYRSRVTRALDGQQVLDRHGDQLYIMKLEGFIFFGTAHGIFERLRAYVNSAPVQYCVLDFSKVTGIDSTGMLSFARMIQWSQEQKITLVFSGLALPMEQRFLHEHSAIPAGALKFFADADHGIEWCEEQIIAEHQLGPGMEMVLIEQLKVILPDDNVSKLLPYLKRCEYQSGEYLIREGDVADVIYFIQSGQVTAQLESPGKNPVRLETIDSGRTVGEIGFFLSTPRTASVVAVQNSVVYSLSLVDLKQMEASDTEVANLFHRLSVILLSQRVMHLTSTVRALERP